MKKRSKKLLAVGWHPGRDDFPALLALAVLPLLVALPELLGLFHADPLIYTAGLARNVRAGWLPGSPYIDPNAGFTTQALGRLGASSWLHGQVPWWNYFTGVGMPLAGEFQSAVFFPLTFLLLLPGGMIWRHLSLQILAGWGCYGLMRQIGLGRLAAFTTGLLFAQCGALAWFADAPVAPLPFLPWLLLGVERAKTHAEQTISHGWRLFAVALALAILAGFPETAYIFCLLALGWAVLRWSQCLPRARLAMAGRLGLGTVIAFALAAPQLLAFLQFLPLAYIGGHTSFFAHAALRPQAILPSLIAPYFFGPIFAYDSGWPFLDLIWANIGGYTDIAVLMLAVYGVACRKDALGFLLAGWIILALAKSFGIPPVAGWWNLVPGVGSIAFFRYAPASWEFALAVLAGFGIEALASHDPRRRGPLLAATAPFVIATAVEFTFAARLWPRIGPLLHLHQWALAAVGWSVLSGLVLLALLAWAPARARAQAVAGLLVLDATLMFALPILSNLHGGKPDRGAITFLQRNLGLQRFFTLGPIAPNYGAYFGIAAINHNYMPIPLHWLDWVRNHLDSAINPELFTGNDRPRTGQLTAAQELVRDPAAYEGLGVKYVIAPAGQNPFGGMLTAPPRPVFTDDVMRIYQLPDPKPYFETPSGVCTLQVQSRTSVTADCATAATLVRRELYYPGWNASIGGRPAAIAEFDGLFQAINLPSGRNAVAFSYAPLHIAWAWLAMGMALAVLTFAGLSRRSQK